jgi:serine/threonine-protein kinase HipA
MKIGGDDRPDWIIERRWQSFAEEIGIAYKLVLQRLVYMKEAVLDVATQLIQDTNLKQNQCSIYDDIHKIIQQRRTKITNSLTAAKDEASES